MTNFSRPGVSDTYTERTTLDEYGFGENETVDGGATADSPTDDETDDSESHPGNTGDCIAISDSTGEACSNARSYMTDGPFCTPHDNAAEVETIYQRMRLVGIVGCGSSKVDLEDGETVRIGELYDSQYFADKWAWAGEFCTQRYVLSAKHGIASGATQVESYDKHIDDHTEVERRAWLERVGGKLRLFADQPFCDAFVVLASQDYVEAISGIGEDLIDDGTDVYEPFFHTTGLPHQRRWMRDALEAGRPMLDRAEIEGRYES